MGAHAGDEQAGGTTHRLVRRASRAVRRRSRARTVLGACAVAASIGIAVVSVAGAVAGATAEPASRAAVQEPGLQRLQIDDARAAPKLERDRFKAVVESSVVSAAAAGAPVVPGYTTPVGTAQKYAAGVVESKGWAPGEFSCLVTLWSKESGWNTHAANPSGAYGIPQAMPGSKMSSAGPDWQNSHETQVDWGIGYIAGRYGTPCGALSHSHTVGWY